MFSFYISLDKRKNVLLGSFTYLICSEGTGEGILPRSLHLAGPCHCHLTLSRALYQVSSPSRVPQVVPQVVRRQLQSLLSYPYPLRIPTKRNGKEELSKRMKHPPPAPRNSHLVFQVIFSHNHCLKYLLLASKS